MEQDRVQFIADKAAGLPPQRRADFLDGACAGDDALRAAIEAELLRRGGTSTSRDATPTLDSTTVLDDRDETLFEAPAARVTSSGAGPASSSPELHAAHVREEVGSTIGRYHLLQLIGEGGFGSVFMAEQKEPVRRKVALKIIKLGMDTRQVIARFEAERQALAMMDHPNIARVLDAGATEAGRPYFVMELVRGVPLTEYCDANSLTVRERIELLIDVCSAVQHAHQKGIIHRDLKPSNVLVTLHDGTPMPKVIDFGIAKATTTDLTEKTVFTEFRQFIGTPEYMSPEQAAMSALDVDTRTDVYALGVMLYELLTGTTPLDRTSLKGKTIADVQRIVTELDTPRLSTRLSTQAEALVEVARRRRTEPSKLKALVSGELDWIAFKAMEKDRTRRYDTARELGEDLRRYLDGLAVLAAPPSRIYKLRTVVRRHRAAVLGSTLLALALVAAVIGTTFGMVRAQRAEGIATQAAAEAAREREAAEASEAAALAARAEAEREAARAMLAEREAAQRAGELERMVEAQAAMIRGVNVASVGDAMRGDVVAEIRESMLRAGLDEADVARRLVEADEVLSLANFTNPALGVIGRTVLGGAETEIEARFADEPLLAAELLQSVAETRSVLGFGDDAVRVIERVHTLRAEALGEDDEQTIATAGLLAWIHLNKGDWPSAIAAFTSAHTRAVAALGAEHALTRVLGYMVTENRMDSLFRNQRADETFWWAAISPGLSLADAQVAMREVPRLFDVLDAEGLAGVLTPTDVDAARAGRVMDAFDEILSSLEAAMGDNNVLITGFKSTAGRNARALKLPQRGEPYLREALAAQKRMLGDAHPSTMITMLEWTQSLTELDRGDEAVVAAREALGIARRTQMATTPFMGQVHDVLVAALLAADRDDEAAEALEAAVTWLRGNAAGDKAALATALVTRVTNLLDRSDAALARRLVSMAREAVSLREEVMPESWLTDNARSLVGATLFMHARTDASLDEAAREAMLAESKAMMVAAYEALLATDTQVDAVSLPLRRRETAERIAALCDFCHTIDAGGGHEAEAALWRERAAAAAGITAPAPETGAAED